MSDRNPKAVLLISGKRKSGKDFCVSLLEKRLNGFVVLRIAAPMKRQYAKERGLDFDKLSDSSPYKERYRKDMIQWSQRLRASDPCFPLRLAIDELMAREKSVWILSDARRLTDIHFFKASEEFKNSKIITIRICASAESRAKRGWVFTEGIDDIDSECGLDSYQEWDHLITNDGSEEDFVKQLQTIINICNHLQ